MTLSEVTLFRVDVAKNRNFRATFSESLTF
jgi:hypothetical protein